MTTEAFIATSLARRLMARIQVSHERRRISVFAGPPGIGKTTAIDAFAQRMPRNVMVVKVARRDAREVLALHHVLENLRRLAGSSSTHFPNAAWVLRNAVFSELCGWASADPWAVRRGEAPAEGFPRLTVIFDEAQNLARSAIEALRYWNDSDRCYAPFPVGMVFVGNSEFSLRADGEGQSAISAAVADRALFVETFDYGDVTDDDLRLFVRARGLSDVGAAAAVIRYFNTPRTARSLRQAGKLLDDLAFVAAGETITSDTVRQALGSG